MATSTETRTLSVNAAAKRFGIGLRAAYRAIHANQLPHLRFGRRIVVPLSALEAYERDAYRPAANGGERKDAGA